MRSGDRGVDVRGEERSAVPGGYGAGAEVDRLCRTARLAAPALAAMPLPVRANLLRTVAAALESARDELVALADAETGLGADRLAAELSRTRIQLMLLAQAVEAGSLLEAVIARAEPAGPELRRMLVPRGPVAVFAAGNFPFAFSVAGGDTASALAAGCPVLVKAHPGHPGLAARCAAAVAAALDRAGAPDGTFALVRGAEAGRELVLHPAVTAVGFTGSVTGGLALFDPAGAGPEATGHGPGPEATGHRPGPEGRELTLVTPGALAAWGAGLVETLLRPVASGTGGPGLFLLPAGAGLPAGHGPRVLDGPRVVEYGDLDELEALLAALPPSRSVTLHAELPGERELARRLVECCALRAGRVVWPRWPGEPAPSGAPVREPAGTTARRFLRPVVYQDLPQELLPAALCDGNPLRIVRRVGNRLGVDG